MHLHRWQLDALDVAGEYDPVSGRYHYPIVVWVVPRRAGKSMAALTGLVARAAGGRGRRAWYTAHRREIAAALWRDDWYPILEASALAPTLQLRRSNGSETIAFPRLSSRVRLFAPDGKALRSQNADLVVVDEAREFTPEVGGALEAAVRPAQLTRPGRQLWLMSSAGRAPAEWLRRYRDLGRAAVDAGERSGICYLEYAAPPDLDPYAPATWWAAHPSLGLHVDIEALEADAATMDPVDWGCEYLGWWEDPADTAEHPVDAEQWDRSGGPHHALARTGPWHLAVDIDLDRGHAALAAATATERTVTVELVAAGPGVEWLLPTVAELNSRRPAASCTVDSFGPAGNLAPDLTRMLGARCRVAGTVEVARACATLVDLVASGRLQHRHQVELDTSILTSTARPYGDGGWLWRRRHTTGTAPAVAATLAAAAAAQPTFGRPMLATA